MQSGVPHDQPATEATRRRDLEKLDEALAIDVERLLHGSVEEVAEVLDGLFEETAVAATVAAPGPAERTLDASPCPADELRGTETEIEPVPSPSPADPVPPSSDLRWRLARGALRLVNEPVDRLGPTARRALDWLAITLLLWVPAIWFLVLAMRR